MFDALRCRFLYGPLDAMLTVDAGALTSVNDFTAAGGRNHRRVHRFARQLALRSPAAFRLAQATVTRPELLPAPFTAASILGHGSGWTVFLLESSVNNAGHAPVVLKVRRKSIGRRLDVLLAQATEYKARFSTVATWYEGCELILPTVFMIAHGPLLARRAMACIQPYVPGPYRDVFSDIAERELLALLGRDEGFRTQFLEVTTRTLRVVHDERRCIDMVGRGNLQLVQSPAGARLCLIDNGVFDLLQKQRDAPSTVTELMVRLRYLEKVRRKLGD
jgi:hypothetical protein